MKPSIGFPPEQRTARKDAPVLHAVYDGFRGNITGKAIETFLAPLPSGDVMENPMKYQMQIEPVHPDPVFPVKPAQILGMVV